MILAFSRHDHNNEPTHFKEKIQAGVKKHTLRLGDRWKTGMIIDFWDNSPRTPQKNPQKFWYYPPHFCQAIEKFEMSFDEIKEGDEDDPKTEIQFDFTLKIGALLMDTPEMLDMVAINDGFEDMFGFFNWFNNARIKSGVNGYKGQIIYWNEAPVVYDHVEAEFFNP